MLICTTLLRVFLWINRKILTNPQQNHPCSHKQVTFLLLTPLQGDISWGNCGGGEPHGSRVLLKGCWLLQVPTQAEKRVRRKELPRGMGMVWVQSPSHSLHCSVSWGYEAKLSLGRGEKYCLILLLLFFSRSKSIWIMGLPWASSVPLWPTRSMGPWGALQRGWGRAV